MPSSGPNPLLQDDFFWNYDAAKLLLADLDRWRVSTHTLIRKNLAGFDVLRLERGFNRFFFLRYFGKTTSYNFR